MAAEREKRSNAGAKMARLLETQEEDDFYKTKYGGFEEEVNDNDYESEDSVSDEIDTDFSIDEDDDVKSDDDDEPRRKKRLVTKAYKEPIKRDESQKPKTKKPKKSPVQIYHGKKSLRHTTSEKTKEIEAATRKRTEKKRLLKEMAAKKNVSEVRRLTQEELLEEAKHTEIMNLRSLEMYQQLELEKKKVRAARTAYTGTIVRYHSTAMPVPDTEPQVVVDGDAQDEHSAQKPTEKCARTFITFTDEACYKRLFDQQKPKSAGKRYCPVTGQRALYFDPLTRTPYASVHAFKVIREAYHKFLEDGKFGKDSSGKKAKQTATVA